MLVSSKQLLREQGPYVQLTTTCVSWNDGKLLVEAFKMKIDN